MKSTQKQRLEHIIRRMQTDTSVDAPADSLHYAQNLYRSRAMEPRPSIFQRVLAVLSVDLAPEGAAFGERSAAPGSDRQLLFEAADNAVDLRIKTSATGFDIRGQVLGDGFENGEIEITGDQKAFTSKIDASSEFRFHGLPAGHYSLSVRGSGTEIFIEQFILE